MSLSNGQSSIPRSVLETKSCFSRQDLVLRAKHGTELKGKYDIEMKCQGLCVCVCVCVCVD